MNTPRTVVACLLSLTLVAAPLRAGPLTPPAGPVVATHKTLTEIEPRIALSAINTPGDADSVFKITQAGSYYLTANLAGVVNQHGIEVTSAGVTIDLNGFEVVGPGSGAGGGFAGVFAASAAERLTVRDGTVRAWPGAGIEANGMYTTVQGVSAVANGGNGMTLANRARVLQCLGSGNGGGGLTFGAWCVAEGCVASTNSGAGISGSNACAFAGCSSSSNQLAGFSGGPASTFDRCSADSNTGVGFAAAGASNFSNCAALQGGNDGFSISSGSSIIGCTARSNVGDGIEIGSASLVLNNTCTANGVGTGDGAGVHVTGSDGRVEGNVCTGADRGIDVDGTGNLIIRNTCATNTLQWTIANGNHYGPIIDRSAIVSVSVNGAAAADTLGTTHPNANFTQ